MKKELKESQVNAKITQSLYDAVYRVAGELDRTVSWLIGQALEEFVERHEAAKKKK